jgi:carbonic anhydrase
MYELISVSSIDDIPIGIRETPIGLLLEYHNLNRDFTDYSQAQLLVGTCMDNRIRFRVPDKFAYIIRTGGVYLRESDFHVSYAIAVGGIKTIAIITHTDCGMVNLESRQKMFVNGMMERAGWIKERANDHFLHSSAKFGISHEADFALGEAERLRMIYPEVQTVPLVYRVEDNLLYRIECPNTE